jgi:hypothetical protein
MEGECSGKQQASGSYVRRAKPRADQQRLQRASNGDVTLAKENGDTSDLRGNLNRECDAESRAYSALEWAASAHDNYCQGCVLVALSSDCDTSGIHADGSQTA